MERHTVEQDDLTHEVTIVRCPDCTFEAIVTLDEERFGDEMAYMPHMKVTTPGEPGVRHGWARCNVPWHPESGPGADTCPL